jgi:hemerythrin-like domain-containing protein
MIEHRLIERAIALLDQQRRAIDGGGAPDDGLLTIIVDFLRTYAEQCHYGKEERLLFAKLRSKTMPPEMMQAMDGLIADHAHARTIISALERLLGSGRNKGRDRDREISRALAELVKLSPEHIKREDQEFFPEAMRHLTREESADLIAQFTEFDHKLLHEKYGAIVKRMEQR